MSRNCTCSLGWVMTVGLLCALFLAPERSAACSCAAYVKNWGFVSDGDLIPSNSRGLLWWGEFEGTTATDQSLPVQIVGASGEPLPVEYERVSKGGSQGLWLFRPRGGFKIGKSYAFTTMQTFTPFGGGEQRVSVTVSDQAAVSPAGPVALKIGAPITDDLQIAAGGSCGVTVNAAQLTIKMELPKAMRAFQDHLYFETIIDGTDHWTPSASICDVIIPGVSWRGRGVDLLFSVCGDNGGLAAGRHTVEMRTSLPGTNVSAVTSKVEVDLKCPKGAIVPKRK
jgi:hypothetical protein